MAEDNGGTLDRLYWPLMRSPSVRLDHCAICGRPYPLEQHHMVLRSAGKLFRHGSEVPKPTLTLCGFGNNLRDADGRYYCHGLAHHRMLHFRWAPARASFKEDNGGAHYGGGHLEYIRTEPCEYAEALKMDGWKKVRTR